MLSLLRRRAWVIGSLCLFALGCAFGSLFFAQHGSFTYVRWLTLAQIATLAAGFWQMVKEVPSFAKLPGDLTLQKLQIEKTILEVQALKAQQEQQSSAKQIVTLSAVMLCISVGVVSSQIAATSSLKKLAALVGERESLRRQLQSSLTELHQVSPARELSLAELEMQAQAMQKENQNLRSEIQRLRRAWSQDFVSAPNYIPCGSVYSEALPAMTIKVRSGAAENTAIVFLLGVGFRPFASYAIWKKEGHSGGWTIIRKFSVQDGKMFERIAITHDRDAVNDRTPENATTTDSTGWIRQLKFFVTDRQMSDPDQARKPPETTSGSVFCSVHPESSAIQQN